MSNGQGMDMSKAMSRGIEEVGELKRKLRETEERLEEMQQREGMLTEDSEKRIAEITKRFYNVKLL